MTTRFLPDARRELQDAYDYYEAERPGLGMEFAAEAWRAIARIEKLPEATALLKGGVRRRQTNRFPYGIIYRVRGDEILIVAVAHLRRRTQYWRGRKDPEA